MKYLIYARVSPKGSKDKEETSIPLQIQFCKEWIKFHGGEVYDVRQDEYISGKDTNRPAFKTILDELESDTAQWDAIIVYKLSRFTRSLRDGSNLFEQLFSKGKGFVSATENLDFSSPAGRAMLGMVQVFNQFEREQTAENIRNKMVNIASKGLWAPGTPPFGYRRGAKKDNRLYVDERESRIVKKGFEMYASEQYRLRDILIAFKEVLCKAQIFRMLRHEVYLGLIPYAGKLYKGQHKAITSESLFKKVQDKLPSPKYNIRPKAQTYPFILSGVLYCGCQENARLAGETAKSGQYAYYLCRHCKKRLKAQEIEQDIISQISKIELTQKDIAKVVKEISALQKKREKELAPEGKRLRIALQKVEKEKSSLYKALTSDKLSEAVINMVNSKAEALNKEEEELKNSLKGIESALASENDIYTEAHSIARKFQRLGDVISTKKVNPESLRQIILENIARITVDEHNIIA